MIIEQEHSRRGLMGAVQFLWMGLMASKSAKIGTGIVAGGSGLALVINVMSARLDDLNKKIEDKDKAIREYVDFRHDQVMREILYIRETQNDIRDTLKTIEHRMYTQKNGGKND